MNTESSSLGAKVEQSLTGNDVSVAQTMQGIRSVAEQSISDTSVIGDLGLSCGWSRFKIKFGLMGQYNGDYEAYNGYIQAGIAW